MILVDSNIFMYASGSDHPYKAPCHNFLIRVAKGEVDASIDVEVLQEILHRYRSIHRWEEGRKVFDLARSIIPAVISVDDVTLEDTRALMDQYPNLRARDALHAVVCRRMAADALCSYDRDFDQISGFRRLEPDQVA